MKTVDSLKTVEKNIRSLVDAALEKSGGLLRLAPCWVPRSFLQPGRRLKLHSDDLYAYGLDRGGIDERWFASTTIAGNENRTPDEGLSYCLFDEFRFTLVNVVQECGAQIVGESIWSKYGRWPVYSKFFDNMGPIPHHMHQSQEHARLVGQEGKPESYYFPPQHNTVGNNFPYTFMGFEPGTTKAEARRCLENWNKGDNGILDLSKAYRLKPGSGWLIGPGILHAPGSLCTYEPQWGSDVFSMFQSLVEGREVPRALLVKNIPPEKHFDLDFILSELDWEANVDPYFKNNHYLEPVPVADTSSEGIPRPLDRLWKNQRGTTLHRERINSEPGHQMHHSRQGCLRFDGGSGWRQNERSHSQLPQAHPVHRTDRRRSFLYGTGCACGRRLRKHQCRRGPGDFAILWPGS